MLHVVDDVVGVGASVKTFAVPVGDPAVLEGQDLAHFELRVAAGFPPDCDVNSSLRLVRHHQLLLVTHLSTLQIQLSYGTNFEDDSNDVNGHSLDKLCDAVNWGQREALAGNLAICCHFLNFSLSVEDNAVVILDRGKLLVRKLDLPAREQVYLVLVQGLFVLLGKLSKKCRLNLCILSVDQLHVQQNSLASCVVPVLQVVLLHDAGLDAPV